MAKVLLPFLYILLAAVPGMAQKKKMASSGPGDAAQVIPLQPDNWDFKPGMVEFTDYKSRPSMKILPKAGTVVLKNLDLADGTIEFDEELLNPYFDLFYFRRQDSLESECFYFRSQLAGNPNAIEAIQYAPTIKGVLLWDLMPHFQGNANFQSHVWNHVKLVISGKQMRVYVNSEKPTMEIPYLEGNATHGTLAFEGEAVISNLVVRPKQVEGLSSWEGIDPVSNDPRYIRQWQVTAATPIPKGIDFSDDLIPGKETAWQPIDAERRGVVNLTRLYGVTRDRRITWLKVHIQADSAQRHRLDLGFSDEVWVFLNGRYLYVDKNYFGQPIMKEPGGRMSIENSSFWVPLAKGDNELLVGVGNNFYGWAIVARLDNLNGIRVSRE